MNEEIDLAEADYLMILGSDDLLTPGSLARAFSVLEMNQALSFACGEGIVCQSDAVHRISTGIELIDKRCRTQKRSAAFVLIRTAKQKRAGHFRSELHHGCDLDRYDASEV